MRVDAAPAPHKRNKTPHKSVTNMALEPDLQQTQDFLTLLANGEPVTFQTFDDGESKNPKLARILHGTLEQHASTLTALNAQGAGVFVMVNRGDLQGRKKENVSAVRALFVDLDGAPLEPIKQASLEPHIVVESSDERFHAYWLVNDCELAQFTPLQAALAAKFDGDIKVKDLPRVMRLPGFWHRKGEPFQTKVMQTKSVQPYATAKIISDLGLQLTPPSEKRQANAPVGKVNGLQTGSRDDGIFRYACSLRGKGMTMDEAQVLVLTMAANSHPPFPETEALKCLSSAWKYDGDRTERLTDMGNAVRLVNLHGRDLRYIPEFRKWLVWDGWRWLMDEDGEIMRRAKSTATAIYTEAKKAAEASEKDMADKLASHASKTQSANRIKAMIELAQSEPGIPVRTGELDQNNYLLGVTNGVINLRTGALREPRQADHITKQAHVAYEPDAQAPLFVAFLQRIMGGNQALVDFIQRAIGYSLTGDTGEQCLFFLHGSGANGKSTLLNAIKELLGDYAMQCPAETLMVKQGGGSIPNDIARLRGARFVATSETEDGRRFAEAMIKQLTGGDVIAARFLFAEYFEFTPNFKIWLGANHKPVIRGDDYAIWRRIRLVPFTVTIPPEQRDKNLPEKLRNEYPGILAWAVQGCMEWQIQGLNPPPEVIAATDEYKSEMDLIGKWIEECCITKPNATAKASSLYGNYKRWVEDNGGHPLSNTKFGLKLGDRGFSKEKSGTVVYRGIGLLDTSDGSDSFYGSTANTPYMGTLPQKLSQPSQLSSDSYLAASRGE
jgi:putative DNA primase/helicase